MSFPGLTLADLLGAVVHFRTTGVPSGDGHLGSLKVLRLVSKGVGNAAMRAALTCKLQLGNGTYVRPEQLLMQLLGARLESLTVTLTTTSGYVSLPVSQQLVACSHHMHELLAGMHMAIGSISTLSLIVINNHVGKDDVPQTSCGQQHIPYVEESGVISGHVFAMLAPAVRKLIDISVSGPCRDAALQAFGNSCPGLVVLRLEAPYVHESAFHNFAADIPGVEYVDLFNNDDQDDGEHDGDDDNNDDGEDDDDSYSDEELGAFMDAFLTASQTCNCLRKIRIFFTGDCQPKLLCNPGSWALVPDTVSSFESNSTVVESADYEALIRRVHFLCLRDPPCDNLLELVQTFPLLQRLKVLYANDMHGFTLCCADGPLLKERLLSGTLELECIAIYVEGTFQEMQDVLAWLPPFPHIEGVVLDFQDVAQMQCLGHFPRVFPKVENLSIVGAAVWSDGLNMDFHFLSPLADCSHLQELATYLHVTITESVYMQLCTSLASLKTLEIAASDHVNVNRLMAQLVFVGRDISIVAVGDQAVDAVIDQADGVMIAQDIDV